MEGSEKSRAEIMVIKGKCKCGVTKSIIPSFLLGEIGIGSVKTMEIIKLLIEGNKLQKKIAEIVKVSEATVSRVKKRYINLDCKKIISEIINSCSNFPESKLKPSKELTGNSEILKYNTTLLEQLKKIKGDYNKCEVIKNMNYVQYYNCCYKNNQKFIIINPEKNLLTT